MLLSIVLVVLILALALFQATHGLFSALIHCVLALCCAALAFGTYEWVAIHWLAPAWKPNLAAPIALAALFGVPLVLLRLVADRVIKRSGLLPTLVDRVGGGVCGLLTAMITVGVLANCLMATPFGTSTLGFARVDVPPTKERKKGEDVKDPVAPVADAKMRELYFVPDRFAVAVAGLLSNGIFSGPRNLFDENPDPVEAGAWLNAVPASVSRFAPPNSISIVRTEPLQFVYREVPGGAAGRRGEESTSTSYEALTPMAGHAFRMIRVQLKKEAMDENKAHLFTLRQFRLVGNSPGDDEAQQFHAIAIQQNKTDPPQPLNRHLRSIKTKWGDWHVMDDPFIPRSDNVAQVEVVFELPTGFDPHYLEYKRGARVAVSFADSTPPVSEPAETSDAQPARPAPASENVPSVAQGGNVRRYTTKTGASFFGDQLPLTLKAYQKHKNVEIQRGTLSDGHLVGYVEEQEAGKDDPVAKFNVDREKRLLHLNTGYLKSKSTYGKALSFAVETLQNYFVEDSNGNRHEIIGKYAVADVDGRQVIEVQYFSNKSGSVGGLGPFNKIKDVHLKGDYELVLLFLVDPGVTITAFSTGGAATRRDDLVAENLVAPE